MLLASAPRSTRARWLGVSALVLTVALADPSTGLAQDGTVYIGGGSNASDGARGVQGGDNVIVNMDAIDGGRGRATSRSGGSASAGSAQRSVEFGEPYRGPAGAILRFPPERPPQSQLMVEPDQLPDRRQASRDAQSTEPTPTRKPAQRQRQEQQPRTAAATAERPADTPDAPASRPDPEPEATQPVEVPDTPTFAEGGAPDGEPRTAPSDTDQTDGGPADGEDGSAPTDLTARPGRKPAAPQATQQDRQTRETATARQTDNEPAGDTTPPDVPESTQAADSQTAEPDTQTRQSQTQTQTQAQTAESGSTDGDAPAGDTADTAAPDTAAADTAAANTGARDTAAADTGDSGQTQTASLPPEGLPEQMRLMFADGSATLSDGAKQDLDRLAQVLEDNPRQRVQLMAFAQGTEDTASQARRLSLSRALAVRTYLIDQGIRSTRMDVRALGATADQGPLDRVDVVPASR